MTHPLIERLTNEFSYPMLTTDTLEAFLAANEYSVLFFTEDASKQKETPDVAVVLPELVATFPMLKAAVISRDSEKELQERFNFLQWPALVFCKGTGFLGSIARIRDWDDYMVSVPEILSRTPKVLA